MIGASAIRTGARLFLAFLTGLSLVGPLAAERGGIAARRGAAREARLGGEDRSPESDAGLALRREYNRVTASIDTLVRRYGGAQLERLIELEPDPGLVPEGMELVLIFWADDEARVFLNGYPVSQTRLTPTQVTIPPLYLGATNLLRAHCWDTDRVESGFMAGLYLRDGDGGLRRVLVTGDSGWSSGDAPAQELYYLHPQPDIPGAHVIWGQTLFGEVRLETEFGADLLRRAARRRPASAPDLGAEERAMQTHDVVGRLVRLQDRRQELAETLRRHQRAAPEPVHYRGYVSGKLAFTLGRAAPLTEEAQSVALSSELHAWAEALPTVQQRLVFEEGRPLKGSDEATPAQEYGGGEAGREDRRSRYQGPPERGPGGDQQVAPVAGAVMSVRQQLAWGLWGAAVGLSLYVGLAGTHWWRLFRGKVWDR